MDGAGKARQGRRSSLRGTRSVQAGFEFRGRFLIGASAIGQRAAQLRLPPILPDNFKFPTRDALSNKVFFLGRQIGEWTGELHNSRMPWLARCKDFMRLGIDAVCQKPLARICFPHNGAPYRPFITGA